MTSVVNSFGVEGVGFREVTLVTFEQFFKQLKYRVAVKTRLDP